MVHKYLDRLMAIRHERASSITLDQFVSALGALDIVLVEGFHEELRAKIEVLDERVDEPLCKLDDNLLAFVTPSARQTALPKFAPSEIQPLADFIEREILARR